MLKHNQTLLSSIGVQYFGSTTGVLPKEGFMQGGVWAKRSSIPGTRTNAIPTGGDPMKAFAMAFGGGEVAARVAAGGIVAGTISAFGVLSAALSCLASTSFTANQGRQVFGSAAGGATTAADLKAYGILKATLLIGATPSSIDIADAVWSRAGAPFTTVGTFGYKLNNLSSGGGGGGGGATAAEVADAVWAYVTRTLTASAGPTSAAIASQVRTELALELSRIDAAISTRLAAAGYMAPSNSDIAAIKAKTDNLPVDPADASDIAASQASLASAIASVPSAAVNASAVRTNLATELARIDAAISSRNATAPDNAGIAAIKAKTDNLPASPANETTVAAKASQASVDAVKTNTDLIPGAL